MNPIIFILILVSCIIVGVWFGVTLVFSNIAYSVFHETDCKYLIEDLERWKGYNEHLFMKTYDRIWAFERLIEEKNCLT